MESHCESRTGGVGVLGGRGVQGLWGRDLSRTTHGYQYSRHFLFKGWKVEGTAMCDWGSRYRCLYCNVQGETVRPGATIIGVEDNEVDYLF